MLNALTKHKRSNMKYFIALLTLAITQIWGDVKLPVVINNNMVLQRDVTVPIWGWAAPGEKVSVTFAGEIKTATTDQEGNWSVKLSAQKVSANPQELKVKGKNEITLTNILVGDVWICSGQSNMEWPIKYCTKKPEKIYESHKANKQLRLFRISKHLRSKVPEKDTQGKWTNCSNEADVMVFSACGFFFGSKLQKDLNIPIGLIDASWGGTPVDQWISNKAYKKYLNKTRWNSIYNAMVVPLAPYAIKGVI